MSSSISVVSQYDYTCNNTWVGLLHHVIHTSLTIQSSTPHIKQYQCYSRGSFTIQYLQISISLIDVLWVYKRSCEHVVTTVTHFYSSINGLVLTSFHLDTQSVKEIDIQFTLDSIIHDRHDVDSIKEYKAK